MALCPFCNEEISSGAVKCKHCGKVLDKERHAALVGAATAASGETSTTPVQPKTSGSILQIIGVIAILAFVAYGILKPATSLPVVVPSVSEAGKGKNESDPQQQLNRQSNIKIDWSIHRPLFTASPGDEKCFANDDGKVADPWGNRRAVADEKEVISADGRSMTVIATFNDGSQDSITYYLKEDECRAAQSAPDKTAIAGTKDQPANTSNAANAVTISSEPVSTPSTPTQPVSAIIGSWICNESGEQRPTIFFPDGSFIFYTAQDAGNHLFISGTYSMKEAELEMAWAIAREIDAVNGRDIISWKIAARTYKVVESNFQVLTYRVDGLTELNLSRTQVRISTGPGGETREKMVQTSCVRASSFPVLEEQRRGVPPVLYSKLKKILAK